ARAELDGLEVGGRNLLVGSDKIWIAPSREFINTFDLAPIFEEFGLDRKYSLSLDIKSSDTSTKNHIQIYMQNGSGTKYNFVNAQIPVTEEFQRVKFEGLTPKISSESEVKAM